MSIKAVTRSTSQDRASKLYDKMRLFIDDMSSIGQSLDKAQDNYRQAMKKLSSGAWKCAGAGGGFS
ncbi:DNA recombination protein RmuC [Citrobacter koseri]|uniref:DNA recombination protein RmuC n=1 Tax=Citrobacter koseri TaxID=545 RepID=A0A2X2WT04_CITKO|nr:DNA recombination protein RmuC [Citrobacter koseri]